MLLLLLLAKGMGWGSRDGPTRGKETRKQGECGGIVLKG